MMLRDTSKWVRSSRKAWGFVWMSPSSWDCRIETKERHFLDVQVPCIYRMHLVYSARLPQVNGMVPYIRYANAANAK